MTDIGSTPGWSHGYQSGFHQTKVSHCSVFFDPQLLDDFVLLAFLAICIRMTVWPQYGIPFFRNDIEGLV